MPRKNQKTSTRTKRSLTLERLDNRQLMAADVSLAVLEVAPEAASQPEVQPMVSTATGAHQEASQVVVQRNDQVPDSQTVDPASRVTGMRTDGSRPSTPIGPTQTLTTRQAVTRSLLPLNNNTRGGAGDLGVAEGETLRVNNGSVGGRDPVDYFKFRTGHSARQVHTVIRLTGLSDDIDLRVYDAQGRFVDSSVRGGARSEYLSLQLNASETYFVKVSPYRSASSDYRLSVATPNFDPLTVRHTNDRYGGYVTTKGTAVLHNGQVHLSLEANSYRWGRFTHYVYAELYDSNDRLLYRSPSLVRETWKYVSGLQIFKQQSASQALSFTVPDHILARVDRLSIRVL